MSWPGRPRGLVGLKSRRRLPARGLSAPSYPDAKHLRPSSANRTRAGRPPGILRNSGGLSCCRAARTARRAAHLRDIRDSLRGKAPQKYLVGDDNGGRGQGHVTTHIYMIICEMRDGKNFFKKSKKGVDKRAKRGYSKQAASSGGYLNEKILKKSKKRS